jgi:hypothetical protein
MRGIYYWGCRFDSFFPLLLCVPYYIQTSSAPFPCSPCHLSLLACRSLCIVVRALDICVRPPFSAFCTHITLRRRSRRLRRFKRWVWSPCNTHAALTRPTGRQRSPPCGTHFFFAMTRHYSAFLGKLLFRVQHRPCCPRPLTFLPYLRFLQRGQYPSRPRRTRAPLRPHQRSTSAFAI